MSTVLTLFHVECGLFSPSFFFFFFSVLCVDPCLLQIVVPPLPGKALKRQLPFRSDEGLFDESFIEERRSGLEQFINRSVSHKITL